MIKVGETAPLFVLKDTEDQEVSLKDLRGKFVLLLFYPADNTRVCTMQLCNYRDNVHRFEQLGIEVLAINPASVESHRNFKKNNDLPFPLLSDENSAVAKQYGAQSLFGMTKRAYVLISPDGKILYSRSDVLPIFHTSGSDLLKDLEACIAQFNPH